MRFLGIRLARVSLFTWGLAAALSALAALLIQPTIGVIAPERVRRASSSRRWAPRSSAGCSACRARSSAASSSAWPRPRSATPPCRRRSPACPSCASSARSFAVCAAAAGSAGATVTPARHAAPQERAARVWRSASCCRRSPPTPCRGCCPGRPRSRSRIGVALGHRRAVAQPAARATPASSRSGHAALLGVGAFAASIVVDRWSAADVPGLGRRRCRGRRRRARHRPAGAAAPRPLPRARHHGLRADDAGVGAALAGLHPRARPAPRSPAGSSATTSSPTRPSTSR